MGRVGNAPSFRVRSIPSWRRWALRCRGQVASSGRWARWGWAAVLTAVQWGFISWCFAVLGSCEEPCKCWMLLLFHPTALRSKEPLWGAVQTCPLSAFSVTARDFCTVCASQSTAEMDLPWLYRWAASPGCLVNFNPICIKSLLKYSSPGQALSVWSVFVKLSGSILICASVSWMLAHKNKATLYKNVTHQAGAEWRKRGKSWR